jgi:hypothetical protein
MDSVSAFSLASRTLDLGVVQVTRLNGANSVWECSSADGPVAVLKNYARDHHTEEHFYSETYLLEQNCDRPFLPRLLHIDESALTAVLAYELSDSGSNVRIISLLQAIQEFSHLQLPEHLHLDKPGICTSWIKGGAHLGIAENLVLAVAQQRVALTNCMERFTASWTHETTIHGDLKLSNIRLQNSTFKIIDWETVGKGPKHWDSAGLIQSILLEIVGNGLLQSWAREQLDEIKMILEVADQPLIDALVVRMVQSALEAAQRATLVPQFAAVVLQLAEHLATGNLQILEAL